MRINIMGMVRDIIVDFDQAHTGTPSPDVWAEAVDMKSGRRIEVDKTEAAQMVEFIVKAREWASVAGVFKDAGRKSNALRHAARIAQELATFAGVDLTIQSTSRKRTNEDGTITRPTLPTVAVDDLVVGDEVTVMRHITRWGLDKYDVFPARVKGRASNGDYWVTSLEDMTSRACRPSEVVVTKRIALAVA